MAIRYIDGFAHYGPGGSNLAESVYRRVEGVTVVPGAGRGGRAAARVNVSTNNSGLQYPNVSDRPSGGFAFQLSALPSDASSVILAQMQSIEPPTFYDFTLVCIMVAANGSIIFRAYSQTGEIFARSAPVVRANANHHIEFTSYFHDRVAQVVAWVDGVEVLSGSFGFPINLPPLNTIPGRLWMGGGEGYPKDGARGITMLVSDLVVRDIEGPVNIGRLFDGLVRTRLVDQDGASQDWEPSIGSAGYPMLNNVPPQDNLRYVSADAAGAVSSFGVAPFPVETVRAAMTAVRYAASGEPLKIKSGMVSGGVQQLAPAHEIARPLWVNDMFETDPATSALWVTASLNEALLVISRET